MLLLFSDGPVSPVVPVLGTLDQLAVGVGTDLVLVTVDWGVPGVEPNVSQTITVLASVDADKPDNRFNDGKADRRGRLWIGEHLSGEREGRPPSRDPVKSDAVSQ